MGYFIYNGESSQRHGILERNPVPPKAEQTYDTITIPGRRENLFREKTLRNDITMEAVLGLTSTTALREIYRWLTPPGRLILSSRPGEVFEVKDIKLSPESAGRRFSRLKISFTCSPFAKRLGEREIEITDLTGRTTITNTGTIASQPIITLMLDKEISNILLGDVNEDGVINASDAALVMQIASIIGAGGTTEDAKEQLGITDTGIIAADINRDGMINGSDAAIILQIAAEHGAGDHPDTVYDVYLHIDDTFMRITAPAICSSKQYPITIDTENQIAYYTDDNGKRVNILYLTFGDFLEFPVGESKFQCTGPVSLVHIKVNEVVA